MKRLLIELIRLVEARDLLQLVCICWIEWIWPKYVRTRHEANIDQNSAAKRQAMYLITNGKMLNGTDTCVINGTVDTALAINVESCELEHVTRRQDDFRL